MTAPSVPSQSELAAAALGSPALTRARALASWVGEEGRTLTVRGVLRPADAARACQDLGIPRRGPRLRSALDVPELMMDWIIALEAGFLELDHRQVWATSWWAAGAAGEPDRVLTAWGTAATAVLDVDLEPCPGCLMILHELHEAAGPLSMEQITATVTNAVEPVGDDPAEHAAETVIRLISFGAADNADGRVSLTPLGTMLAELVLRMHAPPATASAGTVVGMLAELPAGMAWDAARKWREARSAADAARELIAFAEAASPLDRAVALSLARELGPDALAAWRERGTRPGFGAYAREWLRLQGEAVPEDPADDAWLSAEAVCLLLNRLVAELPPAQVQQVLAEQAGDLAEAIQRSGHPQAAELAALLSGRATVESRPVAFQLKITLRGASKPPVWRRVLVGADTTLRELHGVIQEAMGWEESHLYVFAADGQEFSACDPELGHADDRRIRLSHLLAGPGDRLRYTYDFGDDWEHDIVAEERLAMVLGQAYPACVAGKGACPPEDCGGIWGYARLKEVLADPSDPEHDNMLEWMGLDSGADFDPAAFSVAEADARVRGLALAHGRAW